MKQIKRKKEMQTNWADLGSYEKLLVGKTKMYERGKATH
jgi:hypothetical protein